MADNRDFFDETVNENIEEGIPAADEQPAEDVIVSEEPCTDEYTVPSPEETAAPSPEEEEAPEHGEEAALTPAEGGDSSHAGDEDDDEEEDEEEDDNESGFFKMLRSFNPKQAKIFQVIYGIVCGVLCFGALCLESFFPRIDELIKYGVLGVVVVIVVLSFNMGKKTKWDMIPYRAGLAGGVALGIVIYTVYLFAIGQPLF